MAIEIVRVDYHDETQGKQLVELLNNYAQDPMGGAEPLAKATQQQLIGELAKRSDAISLIAYVGDQPAGLLNAFEGFSTFKAKPLLNVHDIAVNPEFRGLGLSHKLLDALEAIGRERGCCKMTLEVLSGNAVACASYRKFGFSPYELDPKMGGAEFWEKPLN